ncbi:MAG: hypothetical protein DRP56_07690 [Planctomycetota bacterium]|nr:MAG: hypothetical protein DRP56_07690 [Planctomycetota bacterium]
MKTHKTRAGFTMVEVLISLTILATLMAAVAFAFDAAVTNYQVNKGIYETVNTGRQALLRITNDLRTATGYFDSSSPPNYIRAIEPLDTDDNSVIITIVNSVTNDYEFIEYRFNSDDNTLYLDNDSGSYVLCKNVTSMTFNGTERVIGRNNGTYPEDVTDTRDVRIVLTITDEAGNISKTLVAATMIRKNM